MPDALTFSNTRDPAEPPSMDKTLCNWGGNYMHTLSLSLWEAFSSNWGRELGWKTSYNIGMIFFVFATATCFAEIVSLHLWKLPFSPLHLLSEWDYMLMLGTYGKRKMVAASRLGLVNGTYNFSQFVPPTALLSLPGMVPTVCGRWEAYTVHCRYIKLHTYNLCYCAPLRCQNGLHTLPPTNGQKD